MNSESTFSSVDGYGVQSQEESKFRKEIKLWKLRRSQVKEEFTEGVKSKCDGNVDWCVLKRKLLELRVKSVVILKANPCILKRGGGIKMWIWPCVERENYLEFESRARMRKIGKNIVRQKEMLRE